MFFCNAVALARASAEFGRKYVTSGTVRIASTYVLAASRYPPLLRIDTVYSRFAAVISATANSGMDGTVSTIWTIPPEHIIS